MTNNKKNYIAEVFVNSALATNDLSRASEQIKANIAVTLLKHRLKIYISETN